MRLLLCLLLTLCLPLQSFALQWEPVLAGKMTLAHEVEHDKRVQHHHHEKDGTVHYDQSDESAKHVQDHTCTPQPAAVPLPPLPVLPPQLISIVRPDGPAPMPDPFLDCPHRPPSAPLG
ncbi:hypothetical protein ACFFTM_16840 [Pseudoduganella plicata]|uniref:DUF2946 domain-containing protein n=1 Tax=Pseudoduganella plicata TaxID=321984 RepID=A0A4P7BKG2_9BURK|nr:hypothetical protein [Pseudoduganella plicata]QBQ38950.1 hypothetical protein E1742_24440 [Pseudoduganella plicata]GGY85996.1 hypothetical protein GCM10007388_18870 [Pseudoduganella plicata]